MTILAVDAAYVWNEVWRIAASLGVEVLVVLAWYWLLKNLGAM